MVFFKATNESGFDAHFSRISYRTDEQYISLYFQQWRPPWPLVCFRHQSTVFVHQPNGAFQDHNIAPSRQMLTVSPFGKQEMLPGRNSGKLRSF